MKSMKTQIGSAIPISHLRLLDLFMIRYVVDGQHDLYSVLSVEKRVIAVWDHKRGRADRLVRYNDSDTWELERKNSAAWPDMLMCVHRI